jgi:mannose-6-phosphate isomerase-like protein (cupin superfamily)
MLGSLDLDWAMAQDAATAAPKAEQKVLLDNDKVRVVENRFVPGAELENASRNYRVARAMKGGTLIRIYADGKKETIEWKAGEVKYFEPSDPFRLRNVGKTEVVVYIVNLK